MLKEFFLHRNLGVYVESTFGKSAGFFNLNQWLKKYLKQYNVLFYDACCPSASATPELVSSASALSLTTEISQLSNTVASSTYTTTLPAGFQGQKKFIQMTALSGTNVVLTPSSLTGHTSITFTGVGQFVELYYAGTAWNIIVNSGTTLS